MKWVLYGLGGLVAIVAVVAIVGALLPRAHVATCRARLRAAPERIWGHLVDVDAFPSWRSDVRAVERLPDRDGHAVWRESRAQGDRITFEATESDAPRRLVTRIADEGLPFGGRWIYELSQEGGGTTVTITEEGEVYNPIFRFVARFFLGYHGSLETALKDLGRKLGETASVERVR